MTYNIEQIRDGLLNNDANVFKYLYKTYGSMVVGYVKKNSGSDHDAREMIHTVLLELWNAFKDGRYRDEGKLDRYIYMLTSNTWRDELRRRKVRQTEDIDQMYRQPEDESEQSLAAAIVKDERIEAIHHCIQRLDTPCDEIIKLFHLQEVPLQTVAEQMQYDYNNLRKRIFDCRKKLKKLVDEYLSNTTR